MSTYNQMKDMYDEATPRNLFGETSTYLVARATMAQIEEQIYIDLYSDQPTVKTEKYFSQSVASLAQRLQMWWEKSGVGLPSFHNLGSFIACTQAELAVIFHSVRMLLNLPVREKACEQILNWC